MITELARRDRVYDTRTYLARFGSRLALILILHDVRKSIRAAASALRYYELFKIVTPARVIRRNAFQ